MQGFGMFRVAEPDRLDDVFEREIDEADLAVLGLAQLRLIGLGGVASYIPLWTSATAIGTSNIYQNGSNIGIGTAGATFPDVNGSIRTNASLFTNTLQTLSTSANMTFMVNGQNAVIITPSVPIEAIKPDLIIFDSIMCLLVGPMQDEATWAPMKPLVCELSARKIAQVWFNHANDLGKSFGDKTREWEMDTTGKLSKVEGDETAIRLEFIKARHRTPANAGQFVPLIFRPSDDWKFEITNAAKSSKSGGEVADIIAEFPSVYDFLADGAPTTLGLDARSTVLKVSTSAIRDELKNRGFLDADENDAITPVSGGHFFRAKGLVETRDFRRKEKANMAALNWSKTRPLPSVRFICVSLRVSPAFQ